MVAADEAQVRQESKSTLRADWFSQGRLSNSPAKSFLHMKRSNDRPEDLRGLSCRERRARRGRNQRRRCEASTQSCKVRIDNRSFNINPDAHVRQGRPKRHSLRGFSHSWKLSDRPIKDNYGTSP